MNKFLCPIQEDKVDPDLKKKNLSFRAESDEDDDDDDDDDEFYHGRPGQK